jgi:alpha-L-fucosidase 2
MEHGLITRSGPATRWLEALPLGNGRLGAMVWGDPEQARFSLNESTLWSGVPGVNDDRAADADAAQTALRRSRELFRRGEVAAAERELSALGATWSQAYQPVGELVIARGGGPDAGREAVRELDLAAAVHRVVEKARDVAGPGAEVRAGAGERARADEGAGSPRLPAGSDGETHLSLISRADEVLVHAFPLGSADPLDVSFASPLHEVERSATSHGLDVVLRAPSDAPPAHAPGSPPVRWEEDASRAAVSLRWRRSGERCLLVCAISTSWRGLGAQPDRPAAEILAEATRVAEAALARGESALLARHAEQRAAWPAGMRLRPGSAEPSAGADGSGARAVRRGGEAAEGAEQAQLIGEVVAYGQYLLEAASRPGLPPANLQGLWNREVRAPWSSNFTTNINLQMNHWPVGPAHVPQAAGSLEEFVGLLRERGRDTARRLYDADGWTVHHNTDAWGYTDPVDGDARWAIWPTGGLWLEWQLDDFARFSGDAPAEIARRRFPHRREAARFALDLLHEDARGRLVTFPSTSPENRWLTAAGEAVALSEGTGMDRWLLRETLRGLLDAAQLLGEQSDPVVRRARDALPRLPAPEIGPDGRLLEWHAQLPEEEPAHRHVSHLALAFPGTEALAADHEEAVARSLDARGDEATGWSLAWKACLWARLRRPARVQRLLEMFLRDAETPDGERAGLYPNLFSAHPPFQMDANFGIVAAVAECLVQSHRGEIELLPALPAMLADGQVTGLRARPGIVVDMTWSRGRPVRVQLRAAGVGAVGTHRVRWAERVLDVQVPADGAVEVDLAGTVG